MEWAAKTSVIGAGSLRCGAAVLAGIFNCPWPTDSHLELCDIHPEALDLFERLARCFAGDTNAALSISPQDDLSEAIEGATTLVLCFGLGDELRERWHDWLREAGVEDLLGRTASLSRAVLLNPTFEAVNEQIHRLREGATIINMVRPISVTAMLLASPAIHLDWPAAIPSDRRVPTAHRILRLVRGDEYTNVELHREAANPLAQALTQISPKMNNRFNAKAMAGWLRELERDAPNLTTRLLRP
ncbi:MAG: hypothetical protein IH851_01595 [Armatimonadetes bacterium]|nr:hypothetical protein [Armatimonadota bacterium]